MFFFWFSFFCRTRILIFRIIFTITLCIIIAHTQNPLLTGQKKPTLQISGMDLSEICVESIFDKQVTLKVSGPKNKIMRFINDAQDTILPFP